MKIAKTLTLTLLASSAAFGGEMVTIAPPPPVEPVAAAPAESKMYAEVAAFYGFAGNDLLNDYPELGSADLYGGGLTVGYKLDKNHSVNLSMSYGYGSASFGRYNSNSWHDDKYKIHNFEFMAGYRYTYQIDEKWEVFAGLGLGIANNSIKNKYVDFEPNTGYYVDKAHGSEWGFAYSAEIGAKYNFTENMYGLLSFEFRGSNAEPTVRSLDYEIQSEKQVYYTINLALGFNF